MNEIIIIYNIENMIYKIRKEQVIFGIIPISMLMSFADEFIKLERNYYND